MFLGFCFIIFDLYQSRRLQTVVYFSVSIMEFFLGRSKQELLIFSFW